MISNSKTRFFSRGMLVFGGAIFHVRCCAHVINLIVHIGLELMDDTLETFQKLVKKISKSSTISKILVKKIFNLDVKRKLNIDMKMHGNSTFNVIDNVLFYKDVLIYLGLKHVSFNNCVLFDADWDKLAVIHKFMKFFYDVTCMFLAIKTTTSNLYFKGAWLI
jgi:hypothetical protein